MKKYIFILLSLLFCACSENEIINAIDSELTQEDSIITVRLNIVGDVQTSETTMTRAQTESTDVLGILVYNKDKMFASGLFDCWDNISLNLKAGSKYDIYCTIITDAKNKLAWYRNGGVRHYWNKYPFYFQHYSGDAYLNNFYYGKGDTYSYYIRASKDIFRSGFVSVKDYDTSDYCAPIERLYAEVLEYAPTVDGVIDLPLKRVSFGLKVKVSGITDGSVSVTCKNNYNTFYSNSNITSNIESEGQLFSMYNIYDAWQYADTDYQEPVELSVVWTRGNGIVQDLGTKTAYVKRNVMNIIKVRLSKNDTDVDVDVDPEEGDMGGEEEDLSN